MTASEVPRIPAPTITTSDSLCSIRRKVAGDDSMAGGDGEGEGEGEESRIRGIAPEKPRDERCRFNGEEGFTKMQV